MSKYSDMKSNPQKYERYKKYQRNYYRNKIMKDAERHKKYKKQKSFYRKKHLKELKNNPIEYKKYRDQRNKYMRDYYLKNIGEREKTRLRMRKYMKKLRKDPKRYKQLLERQKIYYLKKAYNRARNNKQLKRANLDGSRKGVFKE